MRKTLTRLSATRTPCISDESQNKTNCRVIAKGVGGVSNIAEMNIPPHWKKNILNAHFLMLCDDSDGDISDLFSKVARGIHFFPKAPENPS